MKLIDLHTHSTASDGTLSPKELVKHAKEIGLAAIAITDHDTIDGVHEALTAGEELGLEVIPGVELSADFKKELHILGYYFDPNNKEILEDLQQLKNFRDQRNPMIVNRLNELGFAVTLEEIEAEAGGNIVGRPHIAKVLLKKGYVNSIQEAFDLYLATGKPAYFKKEKLTPEEAVQVITKAGGIAVLAHPKYLSLSKEELEELIKELMAAGLKGIEGYYSEYTEEETALYLELAEKYQLIITGGTDFHGSNKPDILLGTGRGNLKVDGEILKNLKLLLKNR